MLKLKFEEFYKYKEMLDFLFEAKEQYGQFINLTNLAETPEGRAIYLAEITDFRTGPAESKGAYYIQACVHAQEGAGTTNALYIIKQLLEDEKYQDLLKNIAFYIIPRVNPDGTEYALTKRSVIRSRYTEAYGKNLLIPKDINNDGYILNMRWKDPAGPMKEDEVDQRIMVRRQPGDKGPFYQILTEGIIENYDKNELSESSSDAVENTKNIKLPRTIDFNRNWPVNWSKDMPGGASYPFSEPEMKAVGDFLVTHPNIFAGIDLHCGGNGILRPSMKPDAEMNQEDLELILHIGKVAEEITGFPLIHEREYKEPWRQPIMLHGNSNDWAYYKMGISHYVIELGNGFNCAGISTKEYFLAEPHIRETIFMRRILKYHDNHKSNLFIQWEEFNHPQLGKIEIGGILQGCGYFMHPPVMEDIAPKVTDFVIYHAKRHPELIITNIDVTPMSSEIYRIRALISNVGGLSTRVMKAGGSVDSNYPIVVKLVVLEGIDIISQIKTFEFNKLDSSGDSERVEWFVQLSDEEMLEKKVVIKANHFRAGMCTKEVAL